MLVFSRIRLCPPATRSAFEEIAVVEQAVKHGGNRSKLSGGPC